MARIENQIFTIVYDAIHSYDDTISMASDYSVAPSHFPHVYFVLGDSFVVARNSARIDELTNLMFEVNIYTNDTFGKQQRAKEIADVIDNEMRLLGFSRDTEVINLAEDDSDVYVRLVTRYVGQIDKNGYFHRR